jgi:hypothetical protein
MRVGIVQPNYVPWRGYFDFIDDVDLFVFYDDVIVGTGKKWRNRNLIKTAKGERWLTVPLRHGQGDMLVHQVSIDYSSNWIDRHLNLLYANYRKAPFWSAYVDTFASILRQQHVFIADLDIALCHWIMASIQICTPTVRSRDLGLGSCDKRHRPLAVLEALGATAYLSGPTATAYLNTEVYSQRSISLQIKSYDYPAYPQLWGDFCGQVSILDLLFNVGPDARRYLKSRMPNQTPDA